MVLLRQLASSSSVTTRTIAYYVVRTSYRRTHITYVFLLARDQSTNDANANNGRVPITSGRHLSIRTYATFLVSTDRRARHATRFRAVYTPAVTEFRSNHSILFVSWQISCKTEHLLPFLACEWTNVNFTLECKFKMNETE